MAVSGKISIKVNDKDLGTVDLAKGLSEKEAEILTWQAILASEPIIYLKDMAALIEIAKGVKTRFNVKKAFAFHGYRDYKIFVTIPVTLDTLKGLGFITKK